MNKAWKENEVQLLQKLSEQGCSLSEMAEQLPGRTESAIKIKLRKSNLQYQYKSNRMYWTEEEKAELEEDWYNENRTMKGLVRKFKRSAGAIKQQALRMGLGERNDYTALTTSQIMQEMQVTRGVVIDWIQRGLKARKSKATGEYMIDSDDLLEFLEQHQHRFDATKISEYLFCQEPDWLREKRRNDYQNVREQSKGYKYTDSDIKRIIFLFKSGKSNIEIANIMNRTEISIKVLLPKLGYVRRYYNDYEVQILEENAEVHTVSELAKMLPLRSERSIQNKCKELGLVIKKR